MRIAVASSGLGHVARGIESWAHDVGHALFRRGESVTLFKGGGQADAPFEVVLPCWQRDAPKTQRLLARLPRPSWRLGLGAGYDIEQTTFALLLVPHLRRLKIDVLHVQDPRLALLVQKARTLGLIRTRTILAHGTEEPLEFLRKVVYLQHLAPWHAEECKQAGVWRETWTAIPNFIDTDVFAPGQSPSLRSELGIPEQARVVLIAAAIKRHHKRIDYLLDEFARTREAAPELPLYLIVAGGREADTDELVKQGEERLGERVRFLVRFPRQRMAELYRAADLFVMTSLKEMMPIALLEASASGLPCLVNAHPILEWMVGPGGVTLDMREPGVLAAQLIGLARDATERARLGALARNHCLTQFSRDRVVEQLLEYYRFVLAH